MLSRDPYTDAHSLEEIRNLGYSTSSSEREEGVISVASPIFDAKGKLVAVLNISGPSVRIDDHRKLEMVKKCTEFSAEISKELGHQ